METYFMIDGLDGLYLLLQQHLLEQLDLYFPFLR